MPPLGIPQRVSGSFQLRAPARPAAAPARKPAPVSLSLSQAANRQVDQQIAPQEQAQTAFNNRQSSVIQSFANALLGKLQPIAGQVGQQYDQAIQQTGALANQSAQFLKDQNPSGQVAQLLQGAGAPQAQQDQIAGQLGQTFGGGAGVLSFLGGAVPGGQMATDKAAAQSQAAQLPGFAALKGQQDLSSALWQQGQDRSKLEATRPALYQAAAQNIRTNNLAQARLDQSQSQYAQTRSDRQTQYAQTRADKQAATKFLDWYRTQGVKKSEAQVNEKAREFGITSGQRQQSIGIAQQRANTSATQGQQRIDLAKKKAAATAKKGGFTPLQTSRFHGNAVAIAEGAFAGGQYDATGQPKANGGYNAKKQATPPLDRAGVINELDQQGIPASIYMPIVNSVYKAGGSRSSVAGPPAPRKRR